MAWGRDGRGAVHIGQHGKEGQIIVTYLVRHFRATEVWEVTFAKLLDATLLRVQRMNLG